MLELAKYRHFLETTFLVLGAPKLIFPEKSQISFYATAVLSLKYNDSICEKVSQLYIYELVKKIPS